MKIQKTSKKLIFPIILFFTCILFTPVFIHKTKDYLVNLRFAQYTDALFITDLRSNGLNLHYTLAHPEEYGLTDIAFTLGCWKPDSWNINQSILENRIFALNRFPSSHLTKENLLTKNILLLSWKTQLSQGNQEKFQECLSPSLGVQAQLPILLAEYAFRTEQDVRDYLCLLSSVDTYFNGIIDFQKMKASQGTFMSDDTVDRIAAQCSSFINNSDENFLLSVFSQKLSSLNSISDSAKEKYTLLHKKILSEKLIPAYQHLEEELLRLKGTGNNNGGLGSLPGGKQYYEYLLKSYCGIYEPVKEIQKRLLTQLQNDLQEIKVLSSRHPDTSGFLFKDQDPSSYPEILKKLLEKDFPPAPETDYNIKYVCKALEAYLSPAFYLTPPVDTLSPNDIYINPYAALTGIPLFTTLAHEGFPGHLYQTVHFALSNPPKIRYLQNMGGYVEGWATYVESYAHGYALKDPDAARLSWLNHSLNLCILSLLDTGIHYNGWNFERTRKFLSGFHITDPSVQKDIYQTILEDPANYLKYYMGYLHFYDLKNDFKKKMGKNFDIIQFHDAILSTGPCQFPILENALKLKLDLHNVQ